MKRLALPIALALVFGLALLIRLYDLTDPPLDFHPTRQLRAALIARGMYYQALADAPEPYRSIAITQRQEEFLIEPPIMEALAAITYLAAGSENIVYPRAFSALFWLLGGLAVFKLARSLSNTGGGLIALLFFLFLPFSIIASRSFQPDPLMIALMAGAFLMTYRWAHSDSWRDALLAGLFAGLAILVKLVAIYSIGLAALLVVLNKGPRKSLRSPQTWAIAGLALLPVLAYYVNGLFISDFLAGQGSFRFFPQLLKDPAFYIRWVEMATNISGLSVLLAGVLSIFLVRDKIARGLLAGMWAGYVVYGFNFPFHIITHDYYQLPLLPIAAVSLAPAAGLLLDELGKRPQKKIALAAVIVLAAGTVLFKTWDARVILARQDQRAKAEAWTVYDGLLPPDASVVSISAAYGYPLAYYGWVTNEPMLNESDAELRSIAGRSAEEVDQKRFAQLDGKDFLFVTSMSEFNRQTDLQDYLSEHATVYLEGDGYIVFDLRPR